MGVFNVPSYGAGNRFVPADFGLGRDCLMGIIDSFNELLLNSTQVPGMGDTIGIGIVDRYFDLRYQVSVSLRPR